MNSLIAALARMTALRDRDALDLALCATMAQALGALDVDVYRLVGEAQDLRWRVRAHWDPATAEAHLRPAAALPQLPALAAAPLRAACARHGSLQEHAEDGGRCRVAWPVQVDGVITGAVECLLPAALTASQRHDAGAIVSVYANIESILNYAECDTLTGLLNRKTFDLALLRLTAPPRPPEDRGAVERRASTPALGAWLGVMDLDHFKKVNDLFGHLIGDEVLLQLAQIMRTTFRDQDQLFRFGGEEFVVLLRCASEDDAFSAVERLRQNVERHRFPRVGTVTVSIGLTEIKIGEPPSAAFERADRAVYFAKEEGRNQICSHSRLVRDGLILDDDRTGDVELF